MKITHNKVGQNLNVRDNGKAEKSDKTAGAKSAVGAADLSAGKVEAKSVSDASQVNLSTRAKDLNTAKEIAMNTPDINEEKVARLQKLIDAGEYKTDAKEIAGKMLDEHMSWE